MAEKLKNHIPLITNMITVLTIVLCIIFAVYGYRAGIFESKESLTAFIKDLGLWGPLVFMFIQALQVVIPVLPGFVTCIVGALVFGPVMGFVYSYTGMCIGSILAFIIARKYGIEFVKKFVSEKTYDKYASWLEKGKKFDIFFMLAIFLPAAPDDLLCFIAGLTRMHWKKFTTIILLGKPWVIAAYSIGTAGMIHAIHFF